MNQHFPFQKPFCYSSVNEPYQFYLFVLRHTRVYNQCLMDDTIIHAQQRHSERSFSEFE